MVEIFKTNIIWSIKFPFACCILYSHLNASVYIYCEDLSAILMIQILCWAGKQISICHKLLCQPRYLLKNMKMQKKAIKSNLMRWWKGNDKLSRIDCGWLLKMMHASVKEINNLIKYILSLFTNLFKISLSF